MAVRTSKEAEAVRGLLAGQQNHQQAQGVWKMRGQMRDSRGPEVRPEQAPCIASQSHTSWARKRLSFLRADEWVNTESPIAFVIMMAASGQVYGDVTGRMK